MTRSEWSTSSSIALLCMFFLLALTAPARAAEHDEAGARVLFGEGRKLADAGRYAEACLKFEESLRLDPGVGTSFNLADCQEHIGQTASAWARFLDVAAATKLEGQWDRERVARARAAALEPKLARLVVAVSDPAPDLTVQRDGVPLGAAAWGIPVPVDPGPHAVAARAPGKREWSQSTTVPDAPTTIVVTVPALEALAPRRPLSAPSEGALLIVQSSSEKTPPPGPARRWSLPVVGLGVLAAAGLTTGLVFAVKLHFANKEAQGLCNSPPDTCQILDDKNRHDNLVNDAHRDLTLAEVGAGIGGAALLAAAYLWWRPGRAPSAKASASRWLVLPGVGLAEGQGPLGAHLEVGW